MISTDTFYKEVMQNFRDLHEKIDKVDKNVDDLCTRTTVLETEYKDHVTEEVKKSDKKYKYIAVITAAIAAVSGIYNSLFKN